MPSSDEVKVACLFDLDGTLLDFEEASFGALNTALGDLRDPSTGCEVTGKMHVSIIGTRKEHWSKQLLEEAKVPPSKLTPEQYVKNWEKALEAQYPKLGLMPGTIEMLAFLKKHSIPAALATSSDRATCDQKLAYQKDIRDAMQFVITGSDVDNGKPAPDPFLAAAKGLGVPIEKCVVFEDAAERRQIRAGGRGHRLRDDRQAVLGRQPRVVWPRRRDARQPR
ncbi:putative pseudouridine-5prime-phosphatase [Diplonema papillatum]|nr:putative pseudouridine-5prime-phosphatase [Diplonema papillatum]